jgi:hypothetical protein
MATLSENTAAVTNRLKEAKAAYAAAVRNQESSTIVSRAKAALDEAQKAYDLSAPQRSDLAKAKAKTDPDYLATLANQTAAEAEVDATAASKLEAEASLAGTVAVNDINEALNSLEPTPATVTKNDPPPGGKTVKSRTPQYNPISGKISGYTIVYSDGTTDFEEVSGGSDNTGQGGTTYTAPDGKIFTNIDLYNAYLGQLKLDEKRQRGQSAYELLYEEFDRYGLASLVTDIEEFIKDGLSKAELTLKLRGTTSYKKRFKANDDRIKNGYAAISEAEYLSLEDSYQNVMRNYGLPASYYTKGDLGVQEGFQKFIANDVSSTELEDRIMTGQERVLNSNPEVMAALKSFYPGITNGDVLAYTLDPTNALTEIKRKITSAEIGGAALQAGLKTTMTRAEELAKAGITKTQAQQGFETVAGGAPRGGQLASIYGQDPYTQTTAETEVFGLSGKTEAATQRKKLTGLEKATFSGQSGATSSALVRDKAGGY